MQDAKRIRGIVHGNHKNEKLSRVQNEMEKLTHHDEQELLSIWEGWRWDDNKGEWLVPELCAKARREEVQGFPEKRAYVKLEGHPSRQDGRGPTRDNQGSPTCGRGGSRRSTRRMQDQNCTRQHRHSRR